MYDLAEYYKLPETAPYSCLFSLPFFSSQFDMLFSLIFLFTFFFGKKWIPVIECLINVILIILVIVLLKNTMTFGHVKLSMMS